MSGEESTVDFGDHPTPDELISTIRRAMHRSEQLISLDEEEVILEPASHVVSYPLQLKDPDYLETVKEGYQILLNQITST